MTSERLSASLERIQTTDAAHDYLQRRLDAALQLHAHSGHHGHHAEVRRTVTHRGHAIAITARFTIEIDGQPCTPSLAMNDHGRLESHALPYSTFASVLDLARALVEQFPEKFAQHHHSPPQDASAHADPAV